MINSEKSDDWTWVDALQMAMPVCAQMAVNYKYKHYSEKMHELYMHTKNT